MTAVYAYAEAHGLEHETMLDLEHLVERMDTAYLSWLADKRKAKEQRAKVRRPSPSSSPGGRVGRVGKGRRR